MLRLALLLALPAVALAQGSFPQPKTFPPDAATLAKIKEKTEELRKAVAELSKTTKTPNTLAEVEVFHKAADWMLRHGEWYTDKTAQQTLEVLDAGLKRAAALKDGKTPWLDARGKPLALGYRSVVDGSVQPYSLQLPADFDPKKKYRLDVVLHGRDATLTEVKFLHGKEFAKAGKAPDHFVMEVYGRGNNAYRWAGERDVRGAINTAYALVFQQLQPRGSREPAFELDQVFLRGFSMGGAGAWHLGLHNPASYSAISPGAGFTTTRGYIGNLPKQLPDYVEKCLRIYDAVNYAENVFNLPVIAYSGEKDPQKAAADNIETALKDFKEPHTFKHLVAPGLAHQQPAEWQKKIDDEFRKFDEKPTYPRRLRFVTYTLAYPDAGGDLTLTGLDAHYERAVIDASFREDRIAVATVNVRGFRISALQSLVAKLPPTATIDGQRVAIPLTPKGFVAGVEFEKVEGKWRVAAKPEERPPSKRPKCTGPIDDAFRGKFAVVDPTGKPWHEGIDAFTTARREQFAALWDKWFRGKLPTASAMEAEKSAANVVLFGDPQSNPAIAKVLPKLPIQWTKEELVVNSVKYDAKTHVPVLIYPNPSGSGYIVINSGHTFGEADLRGTNALLYPRLGDWAVLKPTPTKENPAAFEVVAAGLFDEFWQFPKK